MVQSNYKLFTIRGSKYRDKILVFTLLKAICKLYGSAGMQILEIDFGLEDGDNFQKDLVTVRIKYN